MAKEKQVLECKAGWSRLHGNCTLCGARDDRPCRAPIHDKSFTGWAPGFGQSNKVRNRKRLIDRDKLWKLFVQHYWDVAQKDRDLILCHVDAVLRMIPNIEA